MAKEKKSDRKKLLHKLKHRYRLVVINDATFDERFSAFLTPLNVISGVALITFIIALAIISIIAFTPLKEYIPGYSDTQTRINALNASVKADSLEEAQAIYKAYFDNIQNVLSGNVGGDSAAATEDFEAVKYEELNFSASREDSLLRKEIESQERYALKEDARATAELTGLPGVLFFAPIRGQVTSIFDPGIQHYGIDVTADEGEAIKAVYDGVVTMASFTSDGGNVIQIQHPNNLISIYKHNSALLKKVGDQVSAGESIAIIGNSGEYTDGAHLHFELWYNGQPINPQNFIAFSS